jgi:tetratricopeptide (TPR) repeat protein
LFEVSDYAECLKICEIGCSASASKRSTPYAHLLNTIGCTHFENSNLKASRQAFETVLSIRLELYGPNDLEVANVLGNLGNIESAEGNYDEAQNLFESAATIRKDFSKQDESEMLGMTYMQLGRVAALRGDPHQAWKMYQKSEAYLLRKPGQSEIFSACLSYEYGNLEYAQKNYEKALRFYEKSLALCLKLWPLHPLTASTYYKLACVEFALHHPERALSLLDEANNIAEARDPRDLVGGTARILRKKAGILSEDPIRRSEGLELMQKMEHEYPKIAEQLGLRIDLEDVRTSSEEAFDLLVPGYFR